MIVKSIVCTTAKAVCLILSLRKRRTSLQKSIVPVDRILGWQEKNYKLVLARRACIAPGVKFKETTHNTHRKANMQTHLSIITLILVQDCREDHGHRPKNTNNLPDYIVLNNVHTDSESLARISSHDHYVTIVLAIWNHKCRINKHTEILRIPGWR